MIGKPSRAFSLCSTPAVETESAHGDSVAGPNSSSAADGANGRRAGVGEVSLARARSLVSRIDTAWRRQFGALFSLMTGKIDLENCTQFGEEMC